LSEVLTSSTSPQTSSSSRPPPAVGAVSAIFSVLNDYNQPIAKYLLASFAKSAILQHFIFLIIEII
jgi:hypothetical protein